MTENDMLMIAGRIRKTRIERGLTQEALAKKLGLKSRSSINKIENNPYQVGLEKIKKIARALDVDPDYLVFGNEEDKKEEINRLFDRLSESQQDALLEYLRSMISGKPAQQ